MDESFWDMSYVHQLFTSYNVSHLLSVHFMLLVRSYCVVFVSGSSSVNQSKILATNETIDVVLFSGANWSAGEVIICGNIT
jgi:hypothetical protein